MDRTRSRIAFLGGALGLAGMLALMHCGTSGSSEFPDPAHEDPCQTVYKGVCGAPCAADLDCPNGLYCSDSKCTADCAPNEVCANKALCSPHGRCGSDITGFGDEGGAEAGDASTDAICADTDVVLTKVVPKVEFLLDQSSSMFFNKFPSGGSNNCVPDCRWTVLKDVLIGPSSSPGGVVKQLQAEAELGMQMYSATDSNPSDGDNSVLPGPTDNVCPRFNGKKFAGTTFALNNFPAIDALLRPAGVDDDTPTGPAIRTIVGLADDGGVGDPKGFAAIASPAPKVIVLVTDGEPGLCGDNNPSDPGRAAVVLAAQQAYAQHIRTFVIAIGDTTPTAQAHFTAVANAGQGKDPATGDAGAILPSTPGQLLDALKNIVLDARTCTFTLNGNVEPGSESKGTVTLNGAPVPYDVAGAEGWHLLTPSSLELVGSACTTLKSTPDATLSARFPCGTITPRTN